MKPARKFALEWQSLVARLLAGQDPGIVGAALADLTAMWVLHRSRHAMRAEMLRLQFDVIVGANPNQRANP
jgi:hypothetical protein